MLSAVAALAPALGCQFTQAKYPPEYVQYS